MEIVLNSWGFRCNGVFFVLFMEENKAKGTNEGWTEVPRPLSGLYLDMNPSYFSVQIPFKRKRMRPVFDQ